MPGWTDLNRGILGLSVLLYMQKNPSVEMLYAAEQIAVINMQVYPNEKDTGALHRK